MKKFFSLVLALVMALSLTTAAWGAETTPEPVKDSAELQAAINSGATEIVLDEGEFTADLYVVTANRNLTITGQGAATKLNFKQGQVRLALFDSLTISNCTMGRMVDKSWGQLVFGSSEQAGGVYTISNCIFNGESTQGIYINQNVAATFNIENCTFNGKFGGEGAIVVQNNSTPTAVTLNVSGNAFSVTEGEELAIFYHKDKLALNLSSDVDETVLIKANSNFETAVAKADAGDTFKLTVNVNASDVVVDKPININTNGFTLTDLTVAEGYAIKRTNAMYEVYKLENKDAATTTTTTSGNTTTVEDVVINDSASSTIIDVSADEETKTVEMSAAAAAEVFSTTNAKPVEIVTTEASVTFNADAVETIGTNAAGAAVSLEVEVEEAPAVADVESANTAAFNEVMANADADNAVLLSIELTAGTTELFPDDTATKGTATVKVKLPAGLNTAKLYYLDGADAEYLGEYTADANGYIEVVLEHFSEYVIVGGTRTAASGNVGNNYSSSTVNGTTTTASVADKFVIYPADATNALTNVNTNAFVVKSYTSLSTWTVVNDGVTTNSYIPAYYTLTDGTKLYEADANCGEYRLFKNGVFVTYLNELDEAIAGGNYVDGDFIADAAAYIAKGKGCGTYNVDVYMLNGATPKMVDKNGWNVAVINGKVAVYSNLPAGSYTNHVFTNEVTYKSTTDLTVVAIECDKCEKSFQVVKTTKLPATYKGLTANLYFGGNNYYILLETAATSGTPATPSTDKVTSAETFDAGIAMYVGMSVMAAAGSAVVLKKKD